MTGKIASDHSIKESNQSEESEIKIPVQNKGFKGVNVAATKNRRNL